MKTLFNTLVVLSIVMLIFYLLENGRHIKFDNAVEHDGDTKPPIFVDNDNDNVQHLTISRD